MKEMLDQLEANPNAILNLPLERIKEIVKLAKSGLVTREMCGIEYGFPTTDQRRPVSAEDARGDEYEDQ